MLNESYWLLIYLPYLISLATVNLRLNVQFGISSAVALLGGGTGNLLRTIPERVKTLQTFCFVLFLLADLHPPDKASV